MSSHFLKLFQTQRSLQEGSLSTTKRYSFDDLGDFIEERERIRRLLLANSSAKLKVDYSSFANHTFFNSAVSKFDIAKARVLQEYPFDGNSEEKDAFFLSGTGYENYVFDVWPRSVGYVTLNGTTQYISASDYDNKLCLGTSSLYVSAWVKPNMVNSVHPIVQVMSASTTTSRIGYTLLLSNSAGDVNVKVSLHSGSVFSAVNASFGQYTSSFANVAAIYDQPAQILSVFINGNRVASSSVSFGSLEFAPSSVFVGSGTVAAGSSSLEYFSGSVDEIRIFHTASDLYHQKNFNRYVHSEDFVRLYYKLNEGTTDISSTDSGVVDYSKSAIHGVILNYASSARVSGTVLVEDTGDPILYSYHPSVITFTASVETSASLYDKDNRNMIFRILPEDILLEDDQEAGLLRMFSLAMARYFDELKLYVDQFDNLRITNYDDANETPDLFLPMLKRYFGWKVTDHFGEASPLEFFYGENILVASSGNLTTPLLDIRNQFWRRTLNNLPYLYKTKGKRNNLDAFFNVLGINKNILNVKEYGYNQGASIENNRINREKVARLIGIGTGTLGSLSSSFVKVPSLVTTANNAYTVEAMVQFPHLSAAYSSSVLDGALWQFVDPDQVTGSFALLWTLQSLTSPSGTFILTGSDGQVFSSSIVTVFDGRMINVAAGLKSDQKPFIEVRVLDGDTLASSSFVGVTALSGIFTGSKFDFIVGANSGTYYTKPTQGNFGEVRYWNMPLSSSELDAHALHFESIGVVNPLSDNSKLKGHWALGENKIVGTDGRINGITDLSRNNMFATGVQFPASINPYKSFLLQYNYLSPTVDLKWTDNKVRIRNKSELKLSDLAKDTNEVSLEFNLVDALNEDISKIFSALDIMNDVIGAPINKYRDEYSDLEGYRRVYFERLSTSVNFTNFFKLFRWFDKKLSDSIKQLLPARTKFIGGEQVVESHFLERNRYGYKYPVFRTPKNIPEAVVSASARVDSANSVYLEAQPVGTFAGGRSEQLSKKNVVRTSRDLSIVNKEGAVSQDFVTTFTYGNEDPDRNKNNNTEYYDFNLSTKILYSRSLGSIGDGLWVNKFGVGDSDGLRAITKAAGSSSLTRIFAVGPGYGGSAASSSITVLRSDDGGKAWSNYVIASGGAGGTVGPRYDAHSIWIDFSGTVYLAAQSGSSDSAIVPSWAIYRSHITSSYADWVKVDSVDVSTVHDIAVGSDGRIFACGASGSSLGMWMVRRSHISQSDQWVTVDAIASLSQAFSIDIKNNVVFVAGGNVVRTSSDGGDTWGNTGATPEMYVKDIKVDSSGAIYVVGSGTQGNVGVNGWQIRKSHVTASTVWTVVDHTGSVPYAFRANAISIDPRDESRIHVVGAISASVATASLGISPGTQWIYRTSSDAGQTWVNVFTALDATDGYPVSLPERGGHARAVSKTSSLLFVGGLWHRLFVDTIDPLISNPPNVAMYAKGSTHLITATSFHRHKVDGDRRDSIVYSSEGVNFRNEFSRKILSNKDRDNE